jgi:hypothetical protein
MISRYRKYRAAAGLLSVFTTVFLAAAYHLNCGTFAAVLSAGCHPELANVAGRFLDRAVPIINLLTARLSPILPSFERFDQMPGPQWIHEWTPAAIAVIITTAIWTPLLGTAFVAVHKVLRQRPSQSPMHVHAQGSFEKRLPNDR